VYIVQPEAKRDQFCETKDLCLANRLLNRSQSGAGNTSHKGPVSRMELRAMPITSQTPIVVAKGACIADAVKPKRSLATDRGHWWAKGKEHQATENRC